MSGRRKLYISASAGIAALAIISVLPARISAAEPVNSLTISIKNNMIDLDARDADIRSTLAELFRQQGYAFRLSDDVQGHATVKMTQQPFDRALNLLLRSSSTPLYAEQVDDKWIVRKRMAGDPPAEDPFARLLSPPQQPQQRAPVRKSTARVSIDVKGVPLRDALEKVFTNARVDYSIANETQGMVTLKLTNVPIDQAVRALIRAAGAESYLALNTDTGIYTIRTRRPAPVRRR